MKKGDIALTYDQETNDMRYWRRKIAAGMGVPQSMLISDESCQPPGVPCMLIENAIPDMTLWNVLCEGQITQRFEADLQLLDM